MHYLFHPNLRYKLQKKIISCNSALSYITIWRNPIQNAFRIRSEITAMKLFRNRSYCKHSVFSTKVCNLEVCRFTRLKWPKCVITHALFFRVYNKNGMVVIPFGAKRSWYLQEEIYLRWLPTVSRKVEKMQISTSKSTQEYFGKKWN